MPALGAGFSDPTGKSFLFGTADFRRSTTLHKAENRIKPTIKAYRAAVALTHQSPTWAQLGWALLQDFQLDV